jgi:prepilin-type N-terminal cleavage/methylation domain-containing protein/prepilin-type processing-associated H-X9-DG protein
MTQSKGFTLIELLVVFSIITLLVGVLLPALEATKGTALITRCQSNLRQVAVGIASYQADYDNHYPNKLLLQDPPVEGDKGLNASQSWLGTAGHRGTYQFYGANVRFLNPYVGGPYTDPKAEVPVANCPADEPYGEEALCYKWGTSYRANTTHGRSLTRNDKAVNIFRAGRLASEVLNPGKTVAMYESVAGEVVDPSDKRPSDTFPERVFWHTNRGDFRFNTLFCDGRVAMIAYNPDVWVTDDYTFNIDDFPERPGVNDFLP